MMRRCFPVSPADRLSGLLRSTTSPSTSGTPALPCFSPPRCSVLTGDEEKGIEIRQRFYLRESASEAGRYELACRVAPRPGSPLRPHDLV